MSLLVLPPERWLRFEKKTDYCLEILVPEKKMRLRWLMGIRTIVKLAKGKSTYLLQAYFI